MSEIVQNIIAESARLDALKQRINEEHRKCEEAVGSALEHAINAGEGLVQMKDSLSHGTWGRWLRENFEGSERTAQAYMRLYRRRDEIRNGASDLSIRGALSSLSVPKPEPAETVEEATVPSIPAEAVAEAYGTSVEAIRSGRYKNETREVRNAIADEQERREARGESFDAEERAEHARKVAEAKKRSREAEERHRAEQRKRHGEMFLDVDADVSKARRAIKSALEKIKDGDIPFDDEEVELLERERTRRYRARRGCSAQHLRVIRAPIGTLNSTNWSSGANGVQNGRRSSNQPGRGVELPQPPYNPLIKDRRGSPILHTAVLSRSAPYRCRRVCLMYTRTTSQVCT